MDLNHGSTGYEPVGISGRAASPAVFLTTLPRCAGAEEVAVYERARNARPAASLATRRPDGRAGRERIAADDERSGAHTELPERSMVEEVGPSGGGGSNVASAFTSNIVHAMMGTVSPTMQTRTISVP
jgi:hypothetical protein